MERDKLYIDTTVIVLYFICFATLETIYYILTMGFVPEMNDLVSCILFKNKMQ